MTNTRLSYRTLYYSLLESFLIVAKVFGPSTAGYWAGQFGFTQPLVLAALVSFSVILFITIIPESLSQDEQQSFTFQPFKSFSNLKLFFSLRTVGGASSNNTFPLLSIAFGLFFTTYLGYLSVYILYLKHIFNSSVEIIGYYASLESIIGIFSMLILPWVLTKLMGNIVKSIYWLQIGYVAQSLFFFLFGVVTTEKQIFCCLSILVLTGPIIPMTRAILVNSVASHLQTTILAGFSAIQSTSQLLSPLIIIIYSDNGNIFT